MKNNKYLLCSITLILTLFLILFSACSKKETPEPAAQAEEKSKVEIEFPQGILLSELEPEELAMKYRLSAISYGSASAFLEVEDGDTSGMAARGVKVRTFLGDEGTVIAARFPIDSLPRILELPNVSLFMPDLE